MERKPFLSRIHKLGVPRARRRLWVLSRRRRT